ncbi:hypothetical protein LTR16_009256, partial [Cryomyces antarcticus]
MFRTALARSARLFSTSARYQKSPVDTIKETAKAVDRTISDAAVKGIEKGEQATESLKAAAGLNASKAAGEASAMAGEAKGKAHEVAGAARGSDASAMAGQAQGVMSEMKGEIKGKAQELMGEAKGGDASAM